MENDIEKWYYPDGKVKWEAPYINGKIHGIEKSYYSDGTLKEERLYSHATKKLKNLLKPNSKRL
jgi:antitoxin component YwqK of YwqJK toxin-antitoxin module